MCWSQQQSNHKDVRKVFRIITRVQDLPRFISVFLSLVPFRDLKSQCVDEI